MIKLVLQLSILSILFFICLRYDLGISNTKALSRSVLFTLLIGVLHLGIQHSSIESMGSLSNYGNYDSGTDTEDEYEPDGDDDDDDDDDDEENEDDEGSGETGGDDSSNTDKKKKKKKKKKN
tara:strand:+ start:970 stop:1335 length:366 start_codon:yes stop_codon:yes gene_type:complete